MKRFEAIATIVMPAILVAGPVHAKPAEEAWNELLPKKEWVKNEAFAFVENDPDLPNVLLYGDSISIGYTARVRTRLKDKANVYRLHANGNHSGMFIELMTEMHSAMRSGKLDSPWTFDWDVIHFNVGLHDLKYVVDGRRDKEKGTQVSSTSVYQENLRAIVAYLKEQAPDARLIFATTTPVPEGCPGRFAGDAAKFNAAAAEVLKEFPTIATNDLYAFTKPNHAQWWTKPGNVHFNEKGRDAQGDEVARVLLEALSDRAKAKP